MKGKIEKHHNFFNTKEVYYRIGYQYGAFGERFMDIEEEDMSEFMDDIFSSWMKLDNKTEIVERRAREAVRARKGLHQCEIKRAYEEGWKKGCEEAIEDNKRFQEWLKLKLKEGKKVITEQEEAEQDRDELEREQQEMVETYDNPFPTDEALDFDINVRERV